MSASQNSQGHIFRSAAIAAGRKAGKKLEVCQDQAKVSLKTFSLFYDLPILDIHMCLADGATPLDVDDTTAAVFLANDNRSVSEVQQLRAAAPRPPGIEDEPDSSDEEPVVSKVVISQ